MVFERLERNDTNTGSKEDMSPQNVARLLGSFPFINEMIFRECLFIFRGNGIGDYWENFLWVCVSLTNVRGSIWPWFNLLFQFRSLADCWEKLVVLVWIMAMLLLGSRSSPPMSQTRGTRPPDSPVNGRCTKPLPEDPANWIVGRPSPYQSANGIVRNNDCHRGWV